MVLKANQSEDDLGGHISTFSSAATLYDVGFNYFFKGNDSGEADLIYFSRSLLARYLRKEFS